MTVEQPATASQPRRRGFRFGLRTLAVAILLVGVACGWLGNKVKQGLTRWRKSSANEGEIGS